MDETSNTLRLIELKFPFFVQTSPHSYSDLASVLAFHPMYLVCCQLTGLFSLTNGKWIVLMCEVSLVGRTTDCRNKANWRPSSCPFCSFSLLCNERAELVNVKLWALFDLSSFCFLCLFVVFFCTPPPRGRGSFFGFFILFWLEILKERLSPRTLLSLHNENSWANPPVLFCNSTEYRICRVNPRSTKASGRN